MFKKKFKVSTQFSVSGKDRKTLISVLSHVYRESEVDKLFPSNVDLRHDKITASKDSVYTLISDNEGEIPLIACHETKGGIKELYPSIYALLRVPFLVPTVFYLKPGVESFIINGANLMWPGVERFEHSEPQEEIQEAKGTHF